MSMQFCARGALVAGSIMLATVTHANNAYAKVTRPILKEYFQSGDKPTAQQFSTLIDSTVTFIDDRYLLGLKTYDPKLTYLPGDTVVFKRLGIGDTVPSSPLGTAEFAPASELTGANAPTLDMLHDFAAQSGFLGIQLQDSAGVYNGYLQLHMDAPSGLPNDPPAIFVEYVVYEETPGAPIVVTSVPEPTGGLAVVGNGLFALAARRRRHRKSDVKAH
jgi:hypothetical protein